jgi:hypothetical protein
LLDKGNLMPKPATKSVRRQRGKKAGKTAARLQRGRTGLRVDLARFEAVMKAAERSGLLNDKHSRIAGRVSPALVEQAKKQTGIEADSDLIAFALASVALEDRFAEVFKESRGKVPADLKLGY